MFGQNETDFSGLKLIEEQFDPFFKLWEHAKTYYNGIEKWMNGDIESLDGVTLPKEVDEALMVLKYLKTKCFKDYPFTA